MSPLAALARRELALAWSGGGGPALALAFYAALAVLAPLAAGPAVVHSPTAGAAVAWIGLLLASLLTLDRLFAADHEDGALELLAAGPLPLEIIAAVKCLAQSLAVGGPLALAAPAAALSLGVPARAAGIVAIAAAPSVLTFAFVGGIGASLTLASRRGGLLTATIVLPLLAPPVIFGGGAVGAVLAGSPPAGALAFLAGYSLAAVALAPFAMGAALAASLE